MNPIPNQRRSRCSGCDETGHNIRSCIKIIDEKIILEYSRRIRLTAFPSDLVISRVNIDKLCEKYGLAVRQVSMVDKLERLHRIYVQLGSQHILNRLNERRPAVVIYRPSYLPPPLPPPPLNPIPPGLTVWEWHVLDRFPQTRGIIRHQSQSEKKNPTIQIIVDKTKFPEKETDNGDCPICYENCSYMISTNCNHIYCQPCFNNLMSHSVNKSTLHCPVCRENVKDIFVFSETSSEMMLKA